MVVRSPGGGGVEDRHLVTVPQGVVGDRLPWGGERQGAGGVRPWLLDMRLATVCMSVCGPVYSICTHQPKPIWAWNAVNCEPVVARCSEWGRHFYAVRQFAVWHN